MPEYIKTAAIVFGLLVLFTLIAIMFGFQRAFLSQAFLPPQKSSLSWTPSSDSDKKEGGTSDIVINEATYSVDYNFHIRNEADNPYASFIMSFVREESAFVDVSRYSKLTFTVSCAPENVLSFIVSTFDDKVTEPGKAISYRMPMAYFSCTEEWSEVEIDLRRLEVPEWWLSNYKIDLSKGDYSLNKVARFSFGISQQSPVDVSSRVKLGELVLHGRDWRYIYGVIVVTVLMWVGFIFWCVRQYTRSLTANIKNQLEKDRPLVAYQELSMEPQKDKEKSAVLRFMSTEYANPELSLEMAISTLGINRTKINAILKAELGLTFTAFQNKLRLAEAARLLTDREQANVAEIAYLVGYNNVSYFNKLFKAEYGCTPKVFKSLGHQEPEE